MKGLSQLNNHCPFALLGPRNVKKNGGGGGGFFFQRYLLLVNERHQCKISGNILWLSY